MLRAFAESDEELREAFYSMAREQARTGRMLRADELPAAVQRLMGDDGVELERVLPLLSTSVTELVGSWERMLGLLLACREREGHCDVPNSHLERGDKLGGWLGRQRTAYRRGTLESRRVRALEAAGVVWDPLAAQWERMRGLLEVYREREGNCDVPRRHVEDGAKLGGWLQNQRQAYRARGMSEEEREAKRRGALPDAQVEALEALGVVWEPRGVSTS